MGRCSSHSIISTCSVQRVATAGHTRRVGELWALLLWSSWVFCLLLTASTPFGWPCGSDGIGQVHHSSFFLLAVDCTSNDAESTLSGQHFGCFFAKAALHPFIFTSDLHYDSRYGTAEAYGRACRNDSAPLLGVVGCDAPLGLVASLAADMVVNTPRNATLVVLGDWQRHEGRRNESIAAVALVAKELSKVTSRDTSSPSTGDGSIVPSGGSPYIKGIVSLGNSDFPPNQYLDVSADRQPLIEAYGEALANASLLSRGELYSFSSGGYYYRDLASPRLRVIVLNTLLYSVEIYPAINPLHNPDPLGQFAFLSSKLEDARRSRMPAIIIGHVPPTMDGYGCVMGGGGAAAASNGGAQTSAPAADAPTSAKDEPEGMRGAAESTACRAFMHEEFVSRFKAIVGQFSDVIVYQFYGHTHIFALIADSSMGVPGIVSPAVSPVYGNAPSYLTADYDNETNTFLNFRMRYLKSDSQSLPSSSISSPVWTWFSVNRNELIESMIGPISTIAQAERAVLALWSNAESWGVYRVLASGGVAVNIWDTPESTPTAKRKRYVCYMLNVLPQDYEQCVATFGLGDAAARRTVSGGVIAVCVLSSVVGAIGLVYSFVKLRGMGPVGIPTAYPVAEGLGLGGGLGTASSRMSTNIEGVKAKQSEAMCSADQKYRDDVELKSK